MSESAPLFERVGVLRPLRHRDFRLLWIGQTVSMIGDGIYVFAVAWLVYKDLEASPAVFSLVGAAWSLPQVLFLLATGALSDRMDRRHLMIIGDLLRLAAIGAIGALILTDVITIPLLVGLVFVYGAGQAIFWPAFSSIVPMIVPEDQLVQANSIGSTVRPLAMIVVGPLIGAVVVAAGRDGLGLHRRRAHVHRVRRLHLDDARARRIRGTARSRRTCGPTSARASPYVRSTPWLRVGAPRRDGQPVLRLGAVGDARAVRGDRPDARDGAPARPRVRRRRGGLRSSPRSSWRNGEGCRGSRSP